MSETRALAALKVIEDLREASGDPGKWEAAFEDSDIGESIGIEADGAQIAVILNADQFVRIGEEEEEVAACDARARATAKEIATLRNSAPSMGTLIRALIAKDEARERMDAEIRKESRAAFIAAESVWHERSFEVDVALLRFAESVGGTAGAPTNA